MLCEKNIHIIDEYLFINCLYCKASRNEICSLSNASTVDYISSLSTVNSMMYVSKKILKSDKVSLTGKGVGVAFIDTGVAYHADFLIGTPRLKFFKDFIGNKKNFYDDNGHGTFVCGVCSGNGTLSKFKFSGIAPQTDIFSLKALNADGEASANKILNAMEWIYDNHQKQGVNVVCMSFGSEPLGVNDPIMLGAEALWKDGVVVVAAAGNSGPDYQTIKSPGISSKIITVGGIDDNRYDENTFNRKYFEIADFSSRGPAFRGIKPDVVAPSVDIISCGTKQNYRLLSGTSVATPMIAGLASLVLESKKDATPDQVKRIILRACHPLGFDKYLEGYGLPELS
ncbi:MAG: S8 family peptidase [Candidatus Caccovivens sp.]